MNGKAASIILVLALVFVAFLGIGPALAAGEEDLPYYLRDRGKGVSISMFGTYVEKGTLVIYPFYEYYDDSDMEYDPSEFGFGDEEIDYRGKYEAHEALLFVGYGVTEDLAVELEAAVIDATLEKSDKDDTGTPDVIDESGLGDVEGQIRWRFMRETESRPELFTYFETVFPLQKDKLIIGTQDWEFKLGVGVIKGFGFGTLTFRTAAEYDRGEDEFAVGEYALEYLKRINDPFRVYLGIEGEDDEVEFIPELQWFIRDNIVAKFNLGFGLTSKAADFAPEFGVMFIF